MDRHLDYGDAPAVTTTTSELQTGAGWDGPYSDTKFETLHAAGSVACHVDEAPVHRLMGDGEFRCGAVAVFGDEEVGFTEAG